MPELNPYDLYVITSGGKWSEPALHQLFDNEEEATQVAESTGDAWPNLIFNVMSLDDYLSDLASRNGR